MNRKKVGVPGNPGRMGQPMIVIRLQAEIKSASCFGVSPSLFAEVPTVESDFASIQKASASRKIGESLSSDPPVFWVLDLDSVI